MSLENQIILIAGRPLKYRVRRNKQARRFRVNVTPDEGVVVVIPWRASFREVPSLLEGWQQWLGEKADEFDCWQGPVRKEYATGSPLLVQGVWRTLRITGLPPGRRRNRVTLGGETLLMEVATDDFWNPRPVLEKWLRRLARRELDRLVWHWAEEMDLVPARVIIGDRRTRWGSCSSRGTLSFCYRLVMAPPEVMKAVVIHELCHLAFMNHGRGFRELVGRYCPDHDQAMDWLRENHKDLLL